MRKKTIILLTALAILLLAACQEEQPAAPPEPGAIVVTAVVTADSGEEIEVTRVIRQTIQVPATPTGDISDPESSVILDISFSGSYDGLDPQLIVQDNAIDIMENVFAGLTRYNLQSNAIEPQLATSWQTSDGGRTWTFDLRDDIHWLRPVEAGTMITGRDTKREPVRPVSAGDVVYAIQRACDPRLPTPDVFTLFIIKGCERANGLAEIEQADLDAIGARALDDQTLEIELIQPAAHFLTMTSTWLMRPVPQELVEEMEEEWHLPENLWTSGPFSLGSETLMDSRTVLERNPNWPIPFNGNVDRVNILHLDDDNDAYLLWQDRDLDLSPIPAGQQTSVLSRHQAKADLITNQDVFYLAYNFESPAFSIPEVRQAFGRAIDRERVVREVHDGLGRPMRHLAPPGVIGAPPIDEVGAGYSPDMARQLMDSSIYGDCRLMPPITYMVSTSDIALEQAELLRQMWMEELGCTEEQITIQQVQFGELLATTRPDSGIKRPDLWDLGWASYYPDQDNWLGDVLHCHDSENRQLRPCSEVDQLIRLANRDVTILHRRRHRAHISLIRAWRLRLAPRLGQLHPRPFRRRAIRHLPGRCRCKGSGAKPVSDQQPPASDSPGVAILAAGVTDLGLALTPAQLSLFERYLALLLDWNQRLNLTAIRQPNAIQRSHFLDSLSCAAITGDLNGRRLIDIGAGAGFPGIPLKILYPAMSLTLVESVAKKARFLSAVVDHLDLSGVEIINDRAENVGHMPAHRAGYDWAVARAVAPLPVLAEYLLPLCRAGGHMLAQKGPAAPTEAQDAARALETLGGAQPTLHPVAIPGLDQTRILVVVEKRSPTPEPYPRSPGTPAKNPI
jgi:16S rRNA (guanine(527)-N(7))-methyltransferase RsmG